MVTCSRGLGGRLGVQKPSIRQKGHRSSSSSLRMASSVAQLLEEGIMLDMTLNKFRPSGRRLEWIQHPMPGPKFHLHLQSRKLWPFSNAEPCLLEFIPLHGTTAGVGWGGTVTEATLFSLCVAFCLIIVSPLSHRRRGSGTHNFPV